MSVSSHYIEIQDVAKWYPHKKGLNPFKKAEQKSYVKAVDQVSLSLEKGEILGVIGESGCGKSTLGKILTLLEKPTQGDVLLEGKSLSGLMQKDRKAFYSNVQIIFQNPFDTFTPRNKIEDILLRPLNNYKIGKNKEERLKLCYEALEEGGLKPAEDIMSRYPHELSGGQLQRISIIRAMFLKPKFIIADEPVSMLDVSVRADIIKSLQTLAKKQGASIIFISHDIALTRYISDKIAVMYLGRIVEYAESEELVKNAKHPYTKALISYSGYHIEEKAKKISIKGEPPTPIDPGPGCYFADRCSMASDICRRAYPKSREIEKEHYVSCYKA